MPKGKPNKNHPQCKKCGAYKKCRTPFIPGVRVGRLPIQVLFVGEAPGETEDKWGCPFVGKSGKTILRPEIDKIIDLSYIITNSVRCKPKKENSKNKKPNDDVIKCCNKFLIEEILEYRPKIIVTLGGTAWESITGKKGKLENICSKSQEEIEGRKYHGAIVLPTWHPAFVLRSRSTKPEIYKSFKKAFRILRNLLRKNAS